MSSHSRKAAVLWSGGKDSALALHETLKAGMEIIALVTFAPLNERFRAHPLGLMAFQAEALGFPHIKLYLKEPFRESYMQAIRFLRNEEGIDTLVTGDIAPVDGFPNWIRECAAPFDMEVLTPLWRKEGVGLLENLIHEGFRVVFSCVRSPWLSPDWIGRVLDRFTLDRLQHFAEISGLDLCGERGEYHTLVLDGPGFRQRIEITSYSVTHEDALDYMDIHGIALHGRMPKVPIHHSLNPGTVVA